MFDDKLPLVKDYLKGGLNLLQSETASGKTYRLLEYAALENPNTLFLTNTIKNCQSLLDELFSKFKVEGGGFFEGNIPSFSNNIFISTYAAFNDRCRGLSDEGDLGLLEELKNWDIKSIRTKPKICVITSATLDLLMIDYEREFSVSDNRILFKRKEENMSTLRIHPLLKPNPKYDPTKPISKDNKQHIPLHLNSISCSWLLKELIGKYHPNIVFFDDALALKSMCDFLAISKDNEHYSEVKAWNPIEGGDYVMLKDEM